MLTKEQESECHKDQLEIVGFMEDVKNLKDWSRNIDRDLSDIKSDVQELKPILMEVKDLTSQFTTLINQFKLLTDKVNVSTEVIENKLTKPFNKIQNGCVMAVAFYILAKIGIEIGTAKFIGDLLKEILK